ncbi:MAG: methyltransferase domain-containing protein, partial [Thermoleophilaceae bacterium]|nr:methyltransferase domain-containing protein [Thermoleophilaceae bacterium]
MPRKIPLSVVGKSATSTADLAAEVAEIDWYHTLELAPGVTTPGWLDTRRIARQVPLPTSLEGKRCLDVATFNGFWAFEMERRGAAEVVGIDVLDPARWDWPAGSDPETVATLAERQAGGRGFEIARRALGSSVERLERSVYELDPNEIGTFDVVYLGSLLVHLRDPVGALERVRSVCRETLVVVDGVDPLLSLLFRRLPAATLDGVGRPWWWHGNPAALARLVQAAGFDVIEGPRRLYIPPGEGQPTAPLRPGLLRTRSGQMAFVVSWKGDPHASLVARPRAAAQPPEPSQP